MLTMSKRRSAMRLASSLVACLAAAAVIFDGGTPASASRSEGATSLRLSFSYQTQRGYRYLVQLSVGKPEVDVTLGDPGKISINVPTTFVQGRVINKTASRAAPLAADAADNLLVGAWFKFPKALGKDYIQHQICNKAPYAGHPYGDCYVPTYLELESVLQLGWSCPIAWCRSVSDGGGA